MSAYYNENDKFATAWLRLLIQEKQIADGEVDERSIEEVQPEDLAGFTQCHFFAGIGIWSYALRCAGWPDDRPVWTGSCPCPSFSAAGKGKGFDDPRHLWPAWARLIRECKPATIFGEQVDDAIGFGWLDVVQTDLEKEAYAVGKAVLGACSVGAPQIGQRLYFVAQAASSRRQEAREHGSGQSLFPARPEQRGGTDFVAEAERERIRSGIERSEGAATAGNATETWERERVRDDAERFSEIGGVAQTEHSIGRTLDFDGKDGRNGSDAGRKEAHGEPRTCGEVCGLAASDGGNASAEGLQRSGEHGQQPQDGGTGELGKTERGRREQRNASERRVQEPDERSATGIVGAAHSNGHDRPQKQSAIACRNGQEGRLYHGAGATAGFWADAEWLYCTDGKYRPVEPGTFPLAHGYPNRVGTLRGYGNAICAPQAEEFVRAFMETGE